jgi:heme/copper-type cytochrome/quinol oxidase subunit 4
MTEYNHTDEYNDALTKSDAKNRAWRTFLQGLAIDVAVSLVLFLYAATSVIEWTKTYWILLGLAFAKTLIQSAVASVMRRLVPPKDL